VEQQTAHANEVQQECERQREQDRQLLNEEHRAAIRALATDFPALWRDPKTPDRDRKRMIRLLLEDLTLIRGEQITCKSQDLIGQMI
jgi:hypothetical protein